MKKLFFLFLVSVSCAGFAQKTEIDLAEDFSEIKIYSKIQATLIPSNENKIVATGFDNDEIEAKVKNGVLKIKLGLDNIWSETDTKIKVYYKTAEVIDANEGSYIEIEGSIEQSFLNLKVQEGAQIIAGSLTIDNLEIKSVTGGVIQTSGKAINQTVEVKTGGNYDGEDLKTDTTEVKVQAGGEADVNASKYCKAKVQAGGDIHIYGQPEKVDKKTTLGGTIKLR
ncbi:MULTISPECIES: head GIN domain-containing protein [Mesonia]|uniref:Uncharacterized protein n=1 Tax=Mesonia oceanica TaxID=2687242 RepID=A0AC61Y2Y6_9FLAO|nr:MULTISPECIES: head GIN domain-containing protein [Mesonia]MAN28562.1 chaperonin [Mesonia sp.]MAQ41243.1 chaperonin [Mesonia sp.]MBJ97342.1 chaperonin [Flavobacteriaceae bacterium]VVU98817.1 hypothetical protein FVB9532_00064 [Mesonia oceanica]|tara:strand:+ start:29628 stop:30302 length:675 start_codon:yes stop_codon:yes gene_type:complete